MRNNGIITLLWAILFCCKKTELLSVFLQLGKVVSHLILFHVLDVFFVQGLKHDILPYLMKILRVLFFG